MVTSKSKSIIYYDKGYDQLANGLLVVARHHYHTWARVRSNGERGVKATGLLVSPQCGGDHGWGTPHPPPNGNLICFAVIAQYYPSEGVWTVTKGTD